MSEEKQTYSIFDLPLSTNEISGNEYIEISTPVGNNYYNSKKESLNNISSFLGNTLSCNELQTESKQIVSAINELRSINDTAAAHNSVYRGKWIGTAPTQQQYQEIFNGTFRDLYIGDYWSEDPNDPSKTRWRIACFNYFQNTGKNTKVLTNHAVIIPDVGFEVNNYAGIVDSEGYKSMGGYKYSYARGYDIVQETTACSEGQLSFSINYIPDYIIYVYTQCYAPTSQGTTAQIDVLWEVDPDHTGEDPNNPGQGIVTIKGGNKYVLVGGVPGPDILPTFNGIPSDVGYVYICYAYKKENYGSLYECKQIIDQVFGSDHIMHHEVPLSAYCIGGDRYGFYTSGKYIKEWTDIDIDIPTAESILGNSDMTCYNEYLYNETYFQALKYVPPYISLNTYSFDSTNPPHNFGLNYTLESHVEMSQYPLFIYDPALIHTRAGYWFKNLRTNSVDQDISGYFNGGASNYQVRYLFMDGRGAPSSQYTKGPSEIRTRPVFCISATTEPDVLPGGLI